MYVAPSEKNQLGKTLGSVENYLLNNLKAMSSCSQAVGAGAIDEEKLIQNRRCQRGFWGSVGLF